MKLGIKDEDLQDVGNNGRFGYEVHNGDEEQKRIIADAQLRFAAMDPNNVESYAILLVVRDQNDPDRVTCTVEFAGTSDSKERMFTSFIKALHQDSLARDELNEAHNRERKNDQ